MPTTLTAHNVPASSLPKWLAKHVKVEYSADDISALIDSIDSSQMSQLEMDTSCLPQLPAEILLLILEYVSIDHILDWRLVCRGFRDAIDGRILHHHLHRTQLLAVMEPPQLSRGVSLTPEQKDRLRLVTADFQNVTNASRAGDKACSGPIWDSTHAVFRIEDSWFTAFRDIVGVDPDDYTSLASRPDGWLEHVDGLRLPDPTSGFGELRWCMKLDHAVLDLAFPLVSKSGAMSYDLTVRLDTRTISVRWKAMLFGFLRTEAMLRRMLETVCLSCIRATLAC